jgi:hypothetical protein
MPRTLLLPLLACALLGPAAPLRADLPEAPPTSIHGYVTTDYQGGVLVNDASGKNKIVPNFEQVRFVFGFLSQLGADWAFNSEVEFEHATRTGVKTGAQLAEETEDEAHLLEIGHDPILAAGVVDQHAALVVGGHIAVDGSGRSLGQVRAQGRSRPEQSAGEQWQEQGAGHGVSG